MALQCFLHSGKNLFGRFIQAGRAVEAREHALLTESLVVDVLSLVETIVVKEEGEVVDQGNLLLLVGEIVHDSDGDIRFRIEQSGTCGSVEHHGGGIAGITIGKTGCVEIEYTYEQGSEHLVVVDGAHRMVHGHKDGCW